MVRVRTRDGDTVVAKAFTGEDAETSYRREVAGLRHLPRTPTLLAHDDAARLVVMTDAGRDATLADLLGATTGAGGDPDAAWAAAISWAGALGDAAGRTASRIDAIRADLDGVPVYDPAPALRAGAAALAELAGVEPAALEVDLTRIDALIGSVGAEVAWPTDTCPDNAVQTPNGWMFLDLEGTDVSHAALVAAYPHLPFATCWCVFDPPPDLTEQMLAAFTLALSGHAPHITERPEWLDEVRIAAAAWILATTAWLLPNARDADGPIGPEGRPSPTRRQLLRSRWRWLAEHVGEALPGLAAAGAGAVAWAATAWADEPTLGPYPVFADRDGDDAKGDIPEHE
ncbi:hypothetical protein GCM10025875_33050 [Litorihabitans aurantiacus]|uniref:Aminoglycoside phosphotransferase domain-containing protein n=1 Tax=Litorihabitans aurantiacus TaxID=1930061 RepID=A0AA37XGK9_9MICO|nr:hypothetical protein GCM10025875_33050 [Litorihabitans aurantiacus]